MNMLGDIARLAHAHKAEIANGSFGTGFHQAKMITDNAYKIIFFKKPSAEDSKKAATLFIQTLVNNGNRFVGAAPDTLFVFCCW